MTTESLYSVSGFGHALPRVRPAAATRYTLRQRLRSCYHALWYRLGEQVRWSRGIYREKPAGQLLAELNNSQRTRVAVLRRQFGVEFERHCHAPTALKNYEYLDLLAKTWADWGMSRPAGGVVHDVGASNFWYARALHAFFRPTALTGIEVEGYRLYANGYSRWDYAQGYEKGVPRTKFVVADYADYVQPADTIVAWYPFVTPDPVLAWRMPLGLFAPQALFSRIASNLNPSGLFVMINQGPDEAACAARFCRKAGLVFRHSTEVRATLRARRLPPVMSIWSRC